MKADEFKKRLEGNPELAQNLKEALEGNAGAEEISGILAGAGVDAATIEAILAEHQRKRGAAIGAQELDDEALDAVSGGGTGTSCYSTDDCDRYFKCGCEGQYYHPNGKDTSDNCSWYFGCFTFHYCDESFCGD